MSEIQRINLHDIAIGKPLRWDVMDNTGHLLLREGFVVTDVSQIEALVTRGMYIDKAHAHQLRHDARDAASSRQETPSVLYAIDLAIKRLEGVLRDLQQLPDARQRFLEIARGLRAAVHLNIDLSLAAIHLVHPEGNYNVRHAVDTAMLAMLVAEAMNRAEHEVLELGAAALTMNAGMKALHEKLQRSREPLSAEEAVYVRQHPLASIEALYDAGVEDAGWLLAVLTHHECADGSGYPTGRSSAEIPLSAKILSIADGYCARIAVRGYRKTLLPQLALRDIFVSHAAQVDASLSGYFIRVLGLNPPGIFVRLKNGEVAVVSGRGDKPDACVVHALVKQNGQTYTNPAKHDTSLDMYRIAEAIHAEQAAVTLNLQQIWGEHARL